MYLIVTLQGFTATLTCGAYLRRLLAAFALRQSIGDDTRA